MASLEERFWKKVILIPFHPCWEWIGTKDGYGYGKIWSSEKQRKIFAHHVSLSIHNRNTPEKGMAVDHTCRNRACVNPHHFRIVSLKVNALENSQCLAAINKQKTHCSRGHPLFGDNMFESGLKKRQRYCRICHRMRTKRTREKQKLLKAQDFL